MSAPSRRISRKVKVGAAGIVAALIVLYGALLDVVRREGIAAKHIVLGAVLLVVTILALAPIVLQLRTEITEEGVRQTSFPTSRRRLLRWSEVESVVGWFHQLTGEIVAIRLNSKEFSPKIALHYWDRSSLLETLRKALPKQNREIDEIERRWK